MKLSIIANDDELISVIDDISDDVSFDKLTAYDIEDLLLMLASEKKGNRTMLWSDNDYEEPNEICYVFIENEQPIQIHDSDVLAQAIQDKKELYRITVEYYM